MKRRIIIIIIILLAFALAAVSVSANAPAVSCRCVNENTYACGTGADSKKIYFCTGCPYEPSCINMGCYWLETTICSASELCQPGNPNCVACSISCGGKTCGADDNCGGTCITQAGACPGADVCKYNSTLRDFSCCTPNCVGKECGGDGCGGICGSGWNCPTPGDVCYLNQCCTPICSGTGCEPDSCGGLCDFTCSSSDLLCNPDSGSCDLQVECDPVCANNICGDSDGCDNQCDCGSLETCHNSFAEGYCVPNIGLPQGPFCNCDVGTCPAGSTCWTNYDGCIGRGSAPGMIGICVECEYKKGEPCSFSDQCNNPSDRTWGGGTDCRDYTNYTCIGNHCCEQDEMWDASTNRCVRVVCYLEGGYTTNPANCCQPPNVAQALYLNGTHCCQKGMFWSTTDLACRERDPCYSPLGFFSSSSYCNLVGPNIGSYGTFQMSSWFGSNPSLCLNTILSPDKACCFMNAGMYGFTLPGDQFYLWHEVGNISIY